MIHVTLFKSPFDNKTNNTLDFNSFVDFEQWLYRLSRIPMVKPKKDEFHDIHHAPLISPAIYEDGQTRSNTAVKAWGMWAALDVDDFQGDISDIDTYGYYSVIYSTASSKEDNPKFRMVFPLTHEVPKEDIPSFWYSLNRVMDNLGDKQVKDLSRMYYVPGYYPDAYNFITTIPGKPINPTELIFNFPMPVKPKNNLMDYLPVEMQQELLSNRYKNCSNDYKWTSWKDCPFINEELIMEYKNIVGTGWYHKLYSIMVSIACKAISMKYMITTQEIVDLASEIHLETRGWPTKRNLKKEAERAIEFAIKEM